MVWFSRVLSKPPDQGLLDQPIAHHRRRKEIDIFWRRSCTVETDEQAHFVAKINNNNKNFKEQGNSAKKINLESNLIVRPQVPNVCLCDEERLMNVKEKRQLSSAFVLFQSFNERETKAVSNYHQHLSAPSAGIQTDRTFRVIYDALQSVLLLRIC